jgi:hypothetical protein
MGRPGLPRFTFGAESESHRFAFGAESERCAPADPMTLTASTTADLPTLRAWESIPVRMVSA